jgi:hypothetical protein
MKRTLKRELKVSETAERKVYGPRFSRARLFHSGESCFLPGTMSGKQLICSVCGACLSVLDNNSFPLQNLLRMQSLSYGRTEVCSVE